VKRALAFLTPFGVASTPNETTLAWFPLVGALVGFGVGGLWWLAAKAWAPLLAGAIAVVGDLVFTGLLHFDGLADAGDCWHQCRASGDLKSCPIRSSAPLVP
jgi:adenosylcobinamide-GDP ribazoletransferase